MTVNTTDITSGPYPGNDITTDFDYDFRIENKNQLQVFETDDLGVETLLTVDTDYTVSGIGVDAGGKAIRVAGALPTGFTWYIRSNYQYTQDTDFESQGGFFPDVHEAAMDKLTFLIQQINDQIARAVKFPDGFTGDLNLTLDAPESLEFLRWKSDLSGIESVDLTSLGSPTDASIITYRGITAEEALDTSYDFKTKADMESATWLVVGQVVGMLGYHTEGTGGNKFLTRSVTGATDDGGSIIKSTGNPSIEFVGLFPGGVININQFGAIADFNRSTKTGTDNLSFIQAAIDAAGGSHDITSAYIYDPVMPIHISKGDYGLDLTGLQRILINKNNVRIIGAGMFNTSLIQFGGGNAQEMIRFKEAYACELSELTLDGGLPFTPDGTEVFGADLGLVLDQTASFHSVNLNITNYRIRGKQAIHLWESYFENLRIFNGGFFGTGAVPSAGIAFDNYQQESTFFPGSESNQVKYNKIAFGTVGSLVKCTAPCFNISFDFVVAEGRTWVTDFAPLSEAKWIVDGLTQGFVVDHCWSFHHDQPFDNQAILFNLANAGQNCKFLSYRVFQEIPTASGSFLEVPNIFANASAHPVEVDLAIEDRLDATTTLFASATTGSLITGRIDYRNDSTRTVEDFMGSLGILQYSGDLTFVAGTFTGTTPDVYQWNGKAQKVSQIDGSGLFNEYTVRAIANFDGGAAGGARMEKGITVTRTGAGSYTATFDTAMPDANYAVNLSIQLANLGDQPEIVTQLAGSFTFGIRDNAGTFHDSAIIGISVFR